MKRRNFLKALPAAALALAGCGQAETAPANTASLVFDHSYPLDYAAQFSADCYEGGYVLVNIPDSGRFLMIPEDAAEVDDLPADVVPLRQPLDNIYLVSTSVMDLFVHLDALDCIALSGTKAEGWYVEEAKQAMQEGRIAYAGKYSAPDYERILASGCSLAIENTMILHDPAVKEQLEKFGVPVLIERSSYESGPLARMEWLKLYGILLGRTEQAEEIFRQKVEQVAPILGQESTGKTVAFFSITSNNLITVRRTSRPSTPGPKTSMSSSTTAPSRASWRPVTSSSKSAPCWRSSRLSSPATAGVRPRACSSRAWSWPTSSPI